MSIVPVLLVASILYARARWLKPLEQSAHAVERFGVGDDDRLVPGVQHGVVAHHLDVVGGVDGNDQAAIGHGDVARKHAVGVAP